MKNLLFVLLLGSGFTATGQIRLVTPLNEWRTDYKFTTFPQERRKYTFSEDSVLIGIHYYHELIYTTDLLPTSGWIPSEKFYREDNRRIFYTKEASVFSESLVYDFNFGIGDTLVPTVFQQLTRAITEVGTIQLLDGVTRKTLTMGCENIKWIEGIGELDTHVFFYTLIACSATDDLSVHSIRCFSSNGQLVYLRPDLSTCDISDVETLVSKQIQIYPNPATEIIYLTPSEDETLESVEWYNSLGVLVQNDQINPSQPEVKVSDLLAGFYIGKVTLKSGGIQVFRVVKQ